MPKTKAYYRHKADKLLQQIMVAKYPNCEICGNPTNCMHHFYPKSMAGGLRYDEDNLIPLCHGHHFRHHNGDPTIHAKVLEKRGQKWYDKLTKKKQEFVKSDTITYYKSIIEQYEQL